jgi:hypothetical protein
VYQTFTTRSSPGAKMKKKNASLFKNNNLLPVNSLKERELYEMAAQKKIQSQHLTQRLNRRVKKIEDQLS